MIHNAWSIASGDSNALRKASEDLEKITQPSVNIYCNATGLDEAKIKEMMDTTTWLTSQEAYDYGFSNVQEKNSAMQSLESQYVHSLVMEMKSLQKENEKLKKYKEEKQDIKSSKWDGFF